ncbi:hypothetical protein HA402_008117 [Bradysia odoriphaga]|nr:hypothetical protein HA402_008117 [Bradysia odoriphaga]
MEALGYNTPFASQNSFIHEAPHIYPEGDFRRYSLDQIGEPSVYKRSEIGTHHLQNCAICNESYVAGEMDRHMRKHFNGEYYQCHVCGQEYRNSIRLQKHAKSNHINSRDEFFCDICKKSNVFQTKAGIEDHMKNRHCRPSINELKCPTCGKEFFTRSKFTAHVRGHDRRKWKKCPICNESFGSLTRHMNGTHLKIRNYICDICGSAYTQWTSLKEHIETKHMQIHKRKTENAATWPCEKCGKVFAFRRLLNVHVQLHSGKSYVCNECGQSFRHNKYLAKHRKQHRAIVKLKCTMCEKEYVQKDTLAAEFCSVVTKPEVIEETITGFHQPLAELIENSISEMEALGYNNTFASQNSIIHEAPPIYPEGDKRDESSVYKRSEIGTHHLQNCLICNESYVVGDTDRHMRKHFNGEYYQCHVCGQEYQNSIRLQKHAKSNHINSRDEFFCDICKKSNVFKTKASIKEHMKNRHCRPSKNDMKCSTCGKEFDTRSKFTAHMRVHERRNWKKCPICNKSFGSLTRHMNGTHLKIRNHICDICGSAFTQWTSLKEHIENKHMQIHKLKPEVDLEFIDVVEKSGNFVTNTCEIKHQQKDTLTLPVEFGGINTKPEEEASDLHKTFIELIETSILEGEASEQHSNFVAQRSFFHEAPLIYSEDGYQNTPYTANEMYIRQSQICSICNKSCVIGKMDRHMQQHFNGEFYQCYICGREYRHTHDLEKHAKSKHIAARDEFFCDICKSGRVFETKTSIEEHMKNRHCKEQIKEQGLNCSTCNKDFSTLKQFRAHVKRHDEIKRQPCPICNKNYRCLSRHIKDIHFNIRNHVCDICGSAYKQWNTLKEHIEIQHSPHAEFFCDICQDGKGYRSKGYIKKHFAKVHVKAGQRRKNARKPFYECSFCNVKLPSRYSLKKHVSLPHNDGKHPIFPCKTCDKTFTLKSSLAAHERTHIWHICHETGQPINHPDYLKKHLKQKKDMNKHKCTLCPREYARNFDLVFDFHQPLTELIESSIAETEALGYKNTFISQSSFFPEAPLIYSEDGYQNAGLSYKANEKYLRQSQICSICNESYVIGEMDRHMQQHFNSESFRCHVCGGEYRSLSGIQKHMKSKHFTVRDEFFCDICKSEIVFETEASIEEHMKNKHCKEPIKEQVLNCSTCNKDFVTPKQFKAHMRRHDKSMWKQCPICNKSYSSLSRHMNDKHLNIRNHVCEICGSAYKQWVSLKEHIETNHTPHEEFFCDICNNGKDYRSKAHLKKHFAKVHAKVSQRRRNLCKPFYECQFCNEKLSSRYTLKTHLAVRHNVGDDSNFSCNVCDKTFTLKSSLVVHAKLHTGKLHICRECGQSFNHPNYLRKHLNRHKDIKKRKCTMCEKEYVQNVDLRLHMKKVHGVIVPTNNSCEIVHQQMDTLAVDINIKPEVSEETITDFHQPLTELIENSISEMEALGYNISVSQSSFNHEVPLIHPKYGDQRDEPLVHKASEIGADQSQICSICNESYVVGEMDRHLQQHFNGEFYQCSVCGREYRNFIGLQKHTKSNHVTVGDEFFCDICKVSRNFETKANIEEHMKQRHCSDPIKQPVMNCSTCNKEFFTRKQFTAHMRRHDRSKWKSCPICHKKYDNVKRHMNSKHFNIKNHICETCGSAFKQWTSLKEHIESRHTSQEFFCEICQNGKGYRAKEYLKRHFAKVHTKGHTKVPAKVYPRKYISKPLLPFYECNSCNEKLPSRYALRKHVALRHRNNSHFCCNMCDKTFTLKSSLAVHEKLHAGKLHICHECGQSFNHENYLTKHLARHKNKKRKCTMCEKEYVQNVDLRLHMNKVHGVVLPIEKNSETL